MLNRCVFLDRDGVLNRPFTKEGKCYPPKSLEEFVLLPKVPEALARLKEAGFFLIVVTNQPDVGRGNQKKEIVEAMHAKLLQELPIDDIAVCYDELSVDYKPLPGMLLKASCKHGIDLKQSYMVGDRWRDIGAGKAAGCATILVLGDDKEMREKPDFICNSLYEASQFIC